MIALLTNTVYLKWKKEQEIEKSLKVEQALRERAIQNKLWVEREKIAQKEFLKRQNSEVSIPTKKISPILQLTSKQNIIFPNPFLHLSTFQHATNDLPLKRVSSMPCTFFQKLGVCRYGLGCNKSHIYPDASDTLLIPAMYTEPIDLRAIQFDGQLPTSHYKEFFEDVMGEMKNYGHVVKFVTCKNSHAYLEGNVYIQFKRLESAEKAYAACNNRWYASKPIHCLYVNIPSWRQAICGKYLKNQCPNGRCCYFIHPFPEIRRFKTDPYNDIFNTSKFSTPKPFTRSLLPNDKLLNRSNPRHLLKHRKERDYIRKPIRMLEGSHSRSRTPSPTFRAQSSHKHFIENSPNINHNFYNIDYKNRKNSQELSPRQLKHKQKSLPSKRKSPYNKKDKKHKKDKKRHKKAKDS